MWAAAPFLGEPGCTELRRVISALREERERTRIACASVESEVRHATEEARARIAEMEGDKTKLRLAYDLLEIEMLVVSNKNKELEEALRRYGRHEPDCHAWVPEYMESTNHLCSCRFSAALQDNKWKDGDSDIGDYK